MDDYILAIGSIVSALGLAGTAIAAAGAYRVLGRIEGTVGRYGERLQEHSDAIKDLVFLPKFVREMETDLESIKTDVASILDKLERNGNNEQVSDTADS